MTAFLLVPLPTRGAALNVTPNTIGNDYAGVVSLQISGLNTGETVIVEEFSDFNGDGNLDTHDITFKAFPLTDGALTKYGGVTNLHVPGDLNPLAGSITAEIYMQVLGFEQLTVGKHLYRISSPASRFGSVTVPFTITNAPYASQISGKVKSAGTNVPYALIALFIPSGEGAEPLFTAATDSAGNYSLQMPPGTYMPISFKSNYVTAFDSAPVVVLASGGSVSTDLALTPASRRMAGRISDQDDSFHGLGGVLTIAESASGQVAIGHTDRNGNFSIGVTPDLWEVNPDGASAHFLGYPGREADLGVDCTSGDVTGLSLSLQKGQAMIYGVVRTDTSIPLPGATLWGEEWEKGLDLIPRTDQFGRYFAPVVAGTWELGFEHSDNATYAQYVFSEAARNISVQTGTAVARDFTAKLAPYSIGGFLKDTSQTPLGEIQVWASASLNGITYGTTAKTDSTGFFSMRAFNAQWYVGAACDGEEGLREHDFACMGNTPVTVANANAAVSLTATPCGALQIHTVNLPNGRKDQFYSQTLQAESCSGTLIWFLAPGSGTLPPGIFLQNNGQLSGTPEQYGTWNFVVQVDDGNATAYQPLSLQIENSAAPLNITTTSLPQGTTGSSYSAYLQCTGGQSPYYWGMALGSAPLPQGLSLNAGTGEVYGSPQSGGTFYFIISLSDSATPTGTDEQTVSLTINSAVPPAMGSPTVGTDGKFRFLINGAQGTLYTIQISTDLKNWTPLQSTNAPSSSFTFVADMLGGPGCFYRVLLGQ